MNDNHIGHYPPNYEDIVTATSNAGFTMASDVLICSLLRTLAASKREGRFLELGTGTGLSTSWILDGMDTSSSLISIDNDPGVLSIAKRFLGYDSRLTLIEVDGADWIDANRESKFDFIFADTWHGKYLLLDEALDMVGHGGIYFIDDMLPQTNWPDGHAEKVTSLITSLHGRTDFVMTKQSWGSGAVTMVRVGP
jgi:predicted O-methyltransferase YrrM